MTTPEPGPDNSAPPSLPPEAVNVLDAIDDTLIVIDRDWRFVYLNSRARREAGEPPEQILGRTLWEKYPVLVGTTLETQYRRAMAEQVAVHFETRGAITGRWLEIHAYPSPQALTIYGRDVTPRKTAEDALRESEERHRLIAELTADYAYTCRVDADGTIVLESVTEGFTRVTGFLLEELQQRGGWAALIHPDDLPRSDTSRLLAGHRAMTETRIVTKGGETRWIRYSAQPMRDEAQGRVVRLLGAVQDVTERKEADAKLREYARHMQTLSRRLLEAQETERRRIAGELHDEIGQVLTGVHLSLQHARGYCSAEGLVLLDEAAAVVSRAIGQVRDLSLDLRPSLLDDLGLAPALGWYARRLAQLSGLRLHVEDRDSGPRLPPEVETAGFRVAQEALTNVARHAQARQVWLELRQVPGSFSLTVRDDGRGFDVPAASRDAFQGGSYGLLGMQERVDLLGGRLEVTSRPGVGTTVRACFPLDQGEGKSPLPPGE